MYEAQGRGKEAIAEYQQATISPPMTGAGRCRSGSPNIRQGNLHEAIAQLQRAIDLAPDNAMAFFDLSIAHRQSGRLEQARKDLDQALNLDPTATSMPPSVRCSCSKASSTRRQRWNGRRLN